MNAIVRQATLSPDVWAMITQVAESAHASKKLGLFRSEEAQVKMLTAWEHGFPLTSAFQIVHVINNVPALSPKAVWAKIQIHPDFDGSQYREEILEKNGKFHGYRITLARKSGMKATRQFTLDDADAAGLSKKDNWVGYARNMCYWRALGFAEDVVFPDVTLGMVRADDLGALLDDAGDVVDAQWTTVPSANGNSHTPDVEPDSQPEAEDVADETKLLADLVTTWGAEAVMEAAGGQIPGTLEEIQKAERNLMAQET